MRKIANLRWYLVAMVFGASVLNYLDRQTLSILAPTIQRELGIGDTEYGRLANLFLIAYTIAYLLSGRVTDRIGARWSMALFVTWWSISNMLTGFARSFASLGVFRFMLGLGEAGNYTVAPKVVSEWFPPKERGVAIGIYTLGATVGATIAPWILISIERFHSWQAAFVVTGALGLLWVLPWLWLYRPPEAHPRITDEERRLLADAAASEPSEEAPSAKPSEGALWREVLTRRDVWCLMLARLVTDPSWYFYQFWLAKYLHTDRNLPQDKLAVTWMVYLAADIGALSAGFLSGRLINRGKNPPAARMAVMAGCACLMPLSPLVAFAPGVGSSLAVAMLMVLSHMTWMINLSALVVDRIPKRILATAFGVVAAGSTVGGIMMNEFVGRLVTDHSYMLWFVVAAFLHPIAWIGLRLAGMHRPPVHPDAAPGQAPAPPAPAAAR